VARIAAHLIWALIVRTWDIDLSVLMQGLIDAYRVVFHTLINSLFGWLPFHLTPLTKDLLVIWLAVGTSLARTFYFLFETGGGREVPKWSSPLITRNVDTLIFKIPVIRTLLLLASVVLWPVAALLLLRKPKLCESKGGYKWALVGGPEDIPDRGPRYVIKHDLRLVFAGFLVLVALCVVGFSAVNAAGLSLLPFL
jgi:hypothetical protein